MQRRAKRSGCHRFSFRGAEDQAGYAFFLFDFSSGWPIRLRHCVAYAKPVSSRVWRARTVFAADTLRYCLRLCPRAAGGRLPNRLDWYSN